MITDGICVYCKTSIILCKDPYTYRCPKCDWAKYKCEKCGSEIKMVGGEITKKFVKKEPPPGAKDLNIGKNILEMKNLNYVCSHCNEDYTIRFKGKEKICYQCNKLIEPWKIVTLDVSKNKLKMKISSFSKKIFSLKKIYSGNDYYSYYSNYYVRKKLRYYHPECYYKT